MKNWIDNYWNDKYGCTRNQCRRIIQNAPYREHLDGLRDEYNERKERMQ
jgi:DNA-binding transcriptional MocR family regulator